MALINDCYVAEVCLFPYTFAPKSFAECNGQRLPITQNTALFSLIGTFYGGDGRSNFELPHLQGCVVLGTGAGSGLTDYPSPGYLGGSESVTLLQSEMQVHTHQIQGSGSPASAPSGGNGLLATVPADHPFNSGSPNVLMAPEVLAPAGGSLPHNNMMPYLTLRYCIALVGVFPPRQ